MSKAYPRVAVLISTYNGERFLKEQIESVLAQKEIELNVFVRDDGSSDDTINILGSYRDKITFFQESNVGVGNSFMDVLYKAGKDFDFYAFCDQDDIWKEDKLKRAVSLIEKKDIPLLYCSNQELIDSNANSLGLRYNNIIDTSFRQILNNNRVTGCTMVWNKKLNDIIADDKRKASKGLLKKRIHDVWVAMVASCVGEIVYDNESYIYYRQHENNVVGSKGSSSLEEYKKKLSNKDLRNGRSELAKEMIEKYSDLFIDEVVNEYLTLFANYRNDAKVKSAIKKKGRYLFVFWRILDFV